jgi:hypothetical protein
MKRLLDRLRLLIWVAAARLLDALAGFALRRAERARPPRSDDVRVPPESTAPHPEFQPDFSQGARPEIQPASRKETWAALRPSGHIFERRDTPGAGAFRRDLAEQAPAEWLSLVQPEPPEAWLRVIRERAPHLLEGTPYEMVPPSSEGSVSQVQPEPLKGAPPDEIAAQARSERARQIAENPAREAKPDSHKDGLPRVARLTVHREGVAIIDEMRTGPHPEIMARQIPAGESAQPLGANQSWAGADESEISPRARQTAPSESGERVRSVISELSETEAQRFWSDRGPAPEERVQRAAISEEVPPKMARSSEVGALSIREQPISWPDLPTEKGVEREDEAESGGETQSEIERLHCEQERMAE